MLTKEQKTDIIKKVYGMWSKNGFKMKRQKHKIVHSGSRMLVNNQLINNKNVSLPKSYFQKIRSEVLNFVKSNKMDFSDENYVNKLRSLKGKQNFIKQYKPHKKSVKVTGAILSKLEENFS